MVAFLVLVWSPFILCFRQNVTKVLEDIIIQWPKAKSQVLVENLKIFLPNIRQKELLYV